MSTSSSRRTVPSTGSPRSSDVALKEVESHRERFGSGDTKTLSDLDGRVDGRPVLPYTIGATFIAHRHEPPTPFGHGYDTPWPPFKTGHFRLPQLNYCLTRPPIAGRTLPETHTLTITATLRTGYIYGAQLVLVNGAAVAKIYDSLYDDEFDIYENKRDVVVLADGDYCREAAAYDELRRNAKAQRVIPEYYGSWTIDVHTTVDSQTFTRQVRLILMQHVPGTVMSDIQPLLLPGHTRAAIMKKVLEAESLVYDAGVVHRDLAPRNVILVSPSPTSSLDDPDLRVVIIDFNVCDVIRFSDPGTGRLATTAMRKRWPGKILGPVTRFWGGMGDFAFKGWVSSKAQAANEWLWECFGKTEEYVPLVRDWGDREACPTIGRCGELETGGQEGE